MIPTALPAFATFLEDLLLAASTLTTNAQTVAIPNYALNTGVVLRFVPSFTNTGVMTLSVNGITRTLLAHKPAATN